MYGTLNDKSNNDTSTLLPNGGNGQTQEDIDRQKSMRYLVDGDETPSTLNFISLFRTTVVIAAMILLVTFYYMRARQSSIIMVRMSLPRLHEIDNC